MASCNCGGKTVKVKKVPPKKVPAKKVPAKKIKDVKRSQHLTRVNRRRATKRANANSKGCRCSN